MGKIGFKEFVNNVDDGMIREIRSSLMKHANDFMGACVVSSGDKRLSVSCSQESLRLNRSGKHLIDASVTPTWSGNVVRIEIRVGDEILSQTVDPEHFKSCNARNYMRAFEEAFRRAFAVIKQDGRIS